MPRECGSCLTVIDWSGAVYLLPQMVLTNHRLPAAEALSLRDEILADTRGFGPAPGDVAVCLPTEALEEGKADVLRRLAELPLEWLEEAERSTRGRAALDTGPQTQRGG